MLKKSVGFLLAAGIIVLTLWIFFTFALGVYGNSGSALLLFSVLIGGLYTAYMVLQKFSGVIFAKIGLAILFLIVLSFSFRIPLLSSFFSYMLRLLPLSF